MIIKSDEQIEPTRTWRIWVMVRTAYVLLLNIVVIAVLPPGLLIFSAMLWGTTITLMIFASYFLVALLCIPLVDHFRDVLSKDAMKFCWDTAQEWSEQTTAVREAVPFDKYLEHKRLSMRDYMSLEQLRAEKQKANSRQSKKKIFTKPGG